jgi:hypothetical protein
MRAHREREREKREREREREILTECPDAYGPSGRFEAAAVWPLVQKTVDIPKLAVGLAEFTAIMPALEVVEE